MNNIRNLLDLGNSARDIRHMGASHQLRLVGKQRLQLVDIAHGVGLVTGSRPPFHRQTVAMRRADERC
jgi:hypothetical protein